MRGSLRNWRAFALTTALVACVGMLAGCPGGQPTPQTLEGEIVSTDAEALTVTVSTANGEVTLSYDGVDVYLPGDTDTPSGAADDLTVGTDVVVVATAAANGSLTASRFTVQPAGSNGGGGSGGGTHIELGEGALIIPQNELALTVDGGPLSRNGDLYTGSIDWYSFTGTAGSKYSILTRGNAPVVVSVYRQVDVDGTMAASMLWTTDPTENIDVLFVENPTTSKTAVAEAAWIPSFVAPADGTYYVSVQAAIVTVCEDCGESIIDSNGNVVASSSGDPHVITYHDVRSYSVEVNTVTDASTATELTAGDPADDPTFLMGAVTVTQGDWFTFQGAADQNYMIEFRPVNPTMTGNIEANVYAPSGSVACNAIACVECKATPFYSPVEATYVINVTLAEGADWEDDDVEWGQAEYMIRIVTDDHGNDGGLATTVTLAEGAGATTDTGGYLSSTDNDAFMFELMPYRTYRVATSSPDGALVRVDVSLEDLALAPNGPWDRNNVDGIGNESALFQNDTAWPEYAVASVAPSDLNDAYGLRMGEFILTIFNDDHADIGAPTFEATTITIGTQASGVLWGDADRDNDAGNPPVVADVEDSDLFAFTPAVWPIWHRIEEAGTTLLTVNGNTAVEDDVNTQAVEARDHYESENIEDPVRVHIEGPNTHQLGTPYTVDVTQEDHANLSGDPELNEANAAELTDGTAATGVLWGEPGDDDIFKFTAVPNRTYKVSVTNAEGDTTLGTSLATTATYNIDDPETDRAISVTNGGAEDAVAIVQVAVDGANDEDFGYSVQFDADDHDDSAPTEQADIDALTDLGAAAGSGTLFKADTDIFRFEADPNVTYKVTVNNASGATTLGATDQQDTYPNANPDDFVREITVRHAEMEAKTIFVAVGFAGEETDITYSVSISEDDQDDVVDPLALNLLTPLTGTATNGTLFLGDTDFFAVNTMAATNYEVTLTGAMPADVSIQLFDSMGVDQTGTIMITDNVYAFTSDAMGGTYRLSITAPGADGDVSYGLSAAAP